MNEKKEIPPIELSAKYMAWDVKRIGDSFSRLIELLEKMLPYVVKEQSRPSSSMPF